jgi:hypothetical protein
MRGGIESVLDGTQLHVWRLFKAQGKASPSLAGCCLRGWESDLTCQYYLTVAPSASGVQPSARALNITH